MMSVLQRARDSGKCPPSLLTEDNMDPDGFESVVTKLLDTTGFGLSSDTGVVESFDSALKKATTVDSITDPKQKASLLEQRRCVLLAIAGSTATENKSLEKIVANGYLTTVKLWLDETLAGTTGGVDLLLHMLSNITHLPVTKAVVKSSGMGKAIGAIEKHSICKGTPNEAAIVERVTGIKEAWQASVKARKVQETKETPTSPSSTTNSSTNANKREPAAPAAQPTAKRAKAEAPKETKTSSFSNLLKKVTAGSTSGTSASVANANANQMASKKATTPTKKKSNNRVKWADHFGGQIETARIIEGENTTSTDVPATAVSWTDRKKRDRAREKELLASVKKVKLLDDDDEDEPPPSFGTLKATMPWVSPAPLPERADVSKPALNSAEIGTQNERVKVVTPVKYFSDAEVSPNPTPMSDIEEALDMTAQSSATIQTIPFFAPTQVPEVVAAAIPDISVAPAAASNLFGVDTNALLAATQQLPAATSPGATPELVQALGLPMFLIGQDVQALQTLASSPGLLSTMIDANGMYDQSRLLSLVQTLSGASGLNHDMSAASSYHSSYGPNTSYNKQPSSFGGGSFGGSRSKSDEGNLHVAGYGAGTTQTDIIALFLPYVKVDEVVQKQTFSFVNTSDPAGAQRARDALQGALLNGQPIRINAAQRKARDNSSSTYGQTQPSYGQNGGHSGSGGLLSSYTPPPPRHQPPPPPPPQQPGALPGLNDNVDHVRDDRGNPATKNLFVAGYGPGTSEQELRDVFNKQANVIGVVLKGNFSFVNTSTRQEAVRARQMLQGQIINGGTLRINFAKETGRLGTSFDITYNERSGPNSSRMPGGPGPGGPPGGGPPGPSSYYGRGF